MPILRLEAEGDDWGRIICRRGRVIGGRGRRVIFRRWRVIDRRRRRVVAIIVIPAAVIPMAVIAPVIMVVIISVVMAVPIGPGGLAGGEASADNAGDEKRFRQFA